MDNNISEIKKNIRHKFLHKRKNLSSQQVIERSDLVCLNFINNILNNKKILEIESSNSFIALYLSSNNEVVTSPILDFIIKNNINCCLPRINNFNEIEFIVYQANNQLVANKKFKKILEPANGKIVIPNIIITPLVAFDIKLHRLGMGGGYFDKAIKAHKLVNSKIKTIGLAYDFQLFKPLLPLEKHDQSLDIVVCEKNIFFAN